MPPVYKEAGKFFDSGYAVVTTRDGKRFIINTDGEQLLGVGEYDVFDIQGGNAIVGNDKSQGVVSLTGKLIAPIRLTAECTFELGGKYVIQKVIKELYTRERWAWIYDASGKDLFPDLTCTDVRVLSSDRLAVSTGKENAYGVTQTMIADFNGNRYPLPKTYQTKFVSVEPYAGKDLALVTFWQLKAGDVERRYYFFIDKKAKMVTPEKSAGFITGVLPNGYYYDSQWGVDWRKHDTKGNDLGPAPGEMSILYANNTVVEGPRVKQEEGGIYVSSKTIFTIDGKPIPAPQGFEYLEETFGDTSGNLYYRDSKYSKAGLMDRSGKVLIPMAPGYIYRTGNYYRQNHVDAAGLNDPPKFYDLSGKLVAEIPESTSNGRTPIISGGRTVYVPYNAAVTGVAPPSKVVTVTAAPSHTKLTVDGKSAAVNAYLIDSSNYMKLRDLAALISGTSKQFEITYDSVKGAIDVLTGKPYTPIGGELAPGDGGVKSATTGTSPLYIDGKPVRLKAYIIGGNNFYKLRDVMRVVNVSMGWDGATSSASLNTAQPYTDDSLASGIYAMRSTLEPAKYVDISEGSLSDGAHVITWQRSYDPNQSFLLQKVGGKYRIIAAHSGLALSIDGANPNTQLVQRPVSNDPNQLFALVRQPSGGYHVIASTGQYVCVAAGSTDNGTAIIVWDKTGSKGQEFLFQ